MNLLPLRPSWVGTHAPGALCLVLATVVGAAGGPAKAPTKASIKAPAATGMPRDAALAKGVHALMAEALKEGLPGISVLVAQGDRVLLESAAGKASLELGSPLQPGHRFQIGSLTKQFTAAGILRLVDQGRLDLDAPFSQAWPGYPGGERFTLAQVLNHTSGLTDGYSLPAARKLPQRNAATTETLLATFSGVMDADPGTRWAYSNPGYVLLGALLERIGQRPWHEMIRELVLEDPGLQGIRHPDERTLVPGLVAGYAVERGGTQRRAIPFSLSQAHAAGGLVATPRELWQWQRRLHEGTLLKSATHLRMVSPEGAARAESYGFGLEREVQRGAEVWHHGGNVSGFASELAYEPARRTTVVVMMNADPSPVNPHDLARRILGLALGRPYPVHRAIALAPAQVKAVEGLYRGPTGERMTVTSGAEGLQVRIGDGALRPWMAFAPQGFFRKGSPAVLRWEGGQEGRPDRWLLFPDGDGACETWTREPAS